MSSQEERGQTSAGPERPNDVWYYVWIVQKRLWLLVAVFVIGMTGTLLYVSMLKPEYKASAQLLVTTARPGSVADDDYTGATFFQTETIMETQKELLKNLALAEEVVTRLGLDRANTAPASQSPTLLQRLNRLLRQLIWTTKREGQTVAQPLVTQKANQILASLDVERVRGSRIINVTYRSPNAEEAAQVLNEIVKAHMDQEKQRRFKVTKEKLDWLQEQADSRRTSLQKAEQDLNEYQKSVKDVSFQEKRNITEDKLTILNKALQEAETTRMQAETIRNRLQDHLKAGRPIDTFPRGSYAPEESTIIVNALVNLHTEAIALGKKYGPKHPQMIRTLEQIDALEKKLHEVQRKYVERVESEYQIAKTREDELRKALDGQKKLIFELNERSIEYHSRSLEVETNRRLLEQLLQEISQTSLASTIKESSIQVVSEARVPTAPSGPTRIYAVALGIALSLVTGCILAFLLEIVDSSVKTGDDIERYVKAPFLGLIDKHDSDGAAGVPGSTYLVAVNAPKSNTSENFRKIRTNIIFSAQEAGRRTLLVTSAVPREGKTTVATNLAVVMAQSGKRVLLVDADLRRPMLHKILGLDNRKGLSSYLAKLSSMEEIAVKTPVENLSVVPSGPIPPNQSELLSSESMRAFLDEMAKRYDLVILDCAPVTSVADALVLGSMVDGVVEVVKSHSTARGLVEQATQHLRDVNAKVVGVILNQVDFRKTGYAYGKYYSYRYYGYYDYSYYASEGEPRLEGGKRGHKAHRRSAPASHKSEDVQA